MKHKDLPKRWKSKITDYLRDNGKQGDKLNPNDFEFPLVDIKLKDGSDADFHRVLVIDAPKFSEVVLFTEDAEYYIFNSDKISIDIISKENEKDFLIQKLQERNEKLNQFIPSIALELKAPLRTIKSFSYLLQKDSTEFSKKHLEYLDFIIKSCNSAEELLLERLDYSLNKYKKSELVSVDLKETLADVEKYLTRKIEETELAIYIPDNLPKVLGQKAKLFILFQNLISLAILCKKTDEEKPSIWIDWKYYNDEYVKFSIKYNAVDIKVGHEGIIFDFFELLSRSHKPKSSSKYQGGVELVVCKKIIEQYGGETWIESNKGVDTTFFFTLKLYDSIPLKE